MQLFKKIPFVFDGKEYEIRLLYNHEIINIVAFLNNYPATGYRFQVKLPKGCNVKGVMENYPFKELVEASKIEIMEKNWDQLLEAIQTYG